jgi:hypothetical protein
MHVGFGVTSATAKTVGGARFKRDARMALHAARDEVLAIQFVVRLLVVIEDEFCRLKVATLALLSQLAAVGIVFGVATNRRALLGSVAVFAPGMALLASGYGAMETYQWERAVFSVVEPISRKVGTTGRMTAIALVP